MPRKRIQPKQPFAGEAYLRRIMDAVASPVLVIDCNLSIYDANEAAKRIFGDEADRMPTRLDCDAVRCMHAPNASGGSMHAVECFTCAIRQTSTAFFANE